MKILKRSVGIDCSKDELVCCFAIMDETFTIIFKSNAVFPNNKKGIEQLVKHTQKVLGQEPKVLYVVEVTGVYHQNLAEYLYDKGYDVSVVLPTKANRFAQTLKTKTVTDKTSSQALAVMGLEKKLDRWQKPDPVFYKIKKLTRERSALIDERTKIKNELHAETHGAWPVASTIARYKKRILFLDKQIIEIEKELQNIMNSIAWLKQKVEKVSTIKGVKWLTVLTVASETDGFNLVMNRGQLVSYAGYDVIEKTSGTSVRGKTRISKKGNHHIRKALHFPAITAVKHQQQVRNYYERLLERQKIKMKSYTAVQRKLLLLIYTLWKKDLEYDPNYKCSEQPLRTALTELA
jgi:transposase